jgi:hypothetical protein
MIFTLDETVAALELIKSGKAADIEGFIAELFTKAVVDDQFILAPQLTHIMNSIFISGSFPASESIGMIISLYKGKGDPNDCGNQRGITIITTIAKIYAIMLNTRLSLWRMDGVERRARGQGGFLKNHRTTDHLFLLQHVIDKYRKNNLFTCFVDLSKAFDTISRPKLWERLDEMGIRGRMLTALQAYYSEVKECVKTSQGFSDVFESNLGVKQGCPLSPTLFGLYIDALEDYMCDRFPNSVVMIGCLRVPMLLYADDIVFLAKSQKELQAMLDVFSDFCSDLKLTVNLAKSAVVVFSRSIKGIKSDVQYNGVVVPQKYFYKYLGIIFHRRNGCKKGGEALLAAASRALFVMERYAKLQDISDPSLLHKMFDSLVAPILTYGSEVWGGFEKCEGFDKSNIYDRFYLGFLKRLLKVPAGTDSWMLATEFGKNPVSYRLWEKQCAYWHRLDVVANNESGRLLAVAFRENYKSMLTKCEQISTAPDCWCTRARKGFTKLGACMGGAEMINTCYIPPSTLKYLCDERRYIALHKSVSMAVADNRDVYGHASYTHAAEERRRTYARWFWAGDKGCSPFDIVDDCKRTQLVRFRLGAHQLEVTAGAWKGIERTKRICKCCSMGIVEDEVHFTFECLFYTDIRHQYHELFEGFTVQQNVDSGIIISETDSMMQTFFCQQRQDLLAEFIIACMLRRNTLFDRS